MGASRKVVNGIVGLNRKVMLWIYRLPQCNGLWSHVLIYQVRKQTHAHTQDFIYPPVLSHILEECWQQDHFMRPSAHAISDAVSGTHRPLLEDNGDCSATPLFLDSFMLHPVNRVTACHCSNLEGAGFEACLALSDEGLGESPQIHTILAGAAYNKECEKSELEIDVSVYR